MHHTVDFFHQIHSVLFVPGVAILLVGDFPGSFWQHRWIEWLLEAADSVPFC
jgi:hypothetical protein